MKNRLTFIRPAVAAAALLVCTFACKKDSSSTTTSTTDDQTTATLAAGATSSESIYDDTFDVVTQSSEQAGVSAVAYDPAAANSVGSAVNRSLSRSLSSYIAVACATVTLSPADTTTFPKTMTIDYGSGCTSTNGITRVGKLVVTLTGRLRNPGSTISVQFVNYSVNGYGITGTYSITPVSGTSGALNYTITINNGSIKSPSGTTYTYSCSETYTQVAGIGTTTVTDDVFDITGNVSYSSGSLSVSGIIVTPLVRSADCPNITTGTIDYTYNNIKGVLDFGSGTCDNVATVKVGPITNTITLPR